MHLAMFILGGLTIERYRLEAYSMTSNQVAYASVQVNQQLADETERHNKAVEDEANRHNTETEQLERWSLELKQSEQNNAYEWNTTKNQLTREYNEIMKGYYSASLEEKAWYDSQLASLKEREVNAETVYKSNMAMLESEKNALQFSRQEEEARHNKEMESISNRNIDTQEYANAIKSRQLEYQARQWETENWLAFERYGLEYQRLGLEQTKEAHSYELGLMNAEFKGAENLLRSNELDFQQSKWAEQLELMNKEFEQQKSESKSRVFSNYVGTFTKSKNDGFVNALKAVQVFAPLF